MLESIGGEALEVVFEKEDAEEGGVAPLDRNEPWQHHREIEHDAGPPQAAAEQGPLAAQAGEDADNHERHHGGDGALGQRRGAYKEVNIEEPELAVGFVPRVPAEHADAEGRGQLHVGGGAARKAENRGAGGGDQRRVQLPSVAEAPDVQVDEHHQHEGEAGRGQTGGPVVDAKFAEGEHGAPVVEGRFFQPGMRPQNRSDVIATREHLARHLRVTGFVGADQAEAVAAEDRHEAVKEEKGGQTKQGCGFRDLADRGKPGSHPGQQARRSRLRAAIRLRRPGRLVPACRNAARGPESPEPASVFT